VGTLSFKADSLVSGTATGFLIRYNVEEKGGKAQLFPEEHVAQILQVDGSVTSLTMDKFNNEGIVGTFRGSIYYVNFADRMLVKLTSSHCPNPLNTVTFLQTEKSGAQLLISSSAASSEVRLWAQNHCDQVLSFDEFVQDGIGFVLVNPLNKHKCILGHTNGLLQFLSIDKLQAFGQV